MKASLEIVLLAKDIVTSSGGSECGCFVMGILSNNDTEDDC